MKIVEESIQFDLEGDNNNEEAITNENMQLDEMIESDMMCGGGGGAGPMSDIGSVFSSNMPISSFYFREMVQLEQKTQVLAVRGRKFVRLSTTEKREPIADCDVYNGALITLKDGKAVLVGGSTDAEGKHPMDQTLLIDIKSGKIEVKKSLCEKRSKTSLVSAELKSTTNQIFGRVYLFAIGGQDEHGNPMKGCEKFNVRANVWQAMPNLNKARSLASGNLLGDYLYVFGGSN